MEQTEILFSKLIFGPLQSRRLGTSLGINLLPLDGKLCNLDCVYCECGWTNLRGLKKSQLPGREDVRERLRDKLIDIAEKGGRLDSITFAGNGEPTLHPEFKQVMEDTVLLRNRYFPDTIISVLSNSTMVGKPGIIEGLLLANHAIMKLDAGTERMYQLIDRPVKRNTLQNVVDELKKLKGNLIIQTMFTRGSFEGNILDNTTEKEVSCWIQLLKVVKPQKVMLYSLDRPTPVHTLEKISSKELEQIAMRVLATGIPVQVN
jgi:wyosine [tRNA(Phe)-imidazoG37] synthetase (radical SAM superfamily)